MRGRALNYSGAQFICTNPRPEPDSKSGSRSRRVLGRWAPWIVSEYDLVTTIAIRPVTQPCMFKTGSSIFSAMSRLEFASTTRASFTCMQSIERTSGEFYPLLVAMLAVLVLIFFPPPKQEHFYWLLLVGVTVWVPKYDVNDGFSLTSP